MLRGIRRAFTVPVVTSTQGLDQRFAPLSLLVHTIGTSRYDSANLDITVWDWIPTNRLANQARTQPAVVQLHVSNVCLGCFQHAMLPSTATIACKVDFVAVKTKTVRKVRASVVHFVLQESINPTKDKPRVCLAFLASTATKLRKSNAKNVL